jgi:hypothetical protein
MNPIPGDVMTRHALAVLMACLLCSWPAKEEERPAQKVSVDIAIKMAVANIPAIRAARARADAAEAGIQLARTSFLPKLDMVWQENRASRNNVFGLLLPQSIVLRNFAAGSCHFALGVFTGVDRLRPWPEQSGSLHGGSGDSRHTGHS